MSWTWQLEDPTGARVDPASLGVEVPECDNQGDAESWLGEAWRDLLERGSRPSRCSRTASGSTARWAWPRPEGPPPPAASLREAGGQRGPLLSPGWSWRGR